MPAVLSATTAMQDDGNSTGIQVILLTLLVVAVAVGLTRRARRYEQHTGRRAVSDVLLFASGTDRRLTESDAETSADVRHYVGLGGAVLITATFAVVSLTVALSVAFSSRNTWWIVYLPFALLYGVTIFTIDRLLVSLPLNPIRFGNVPSDITTPTYPPTTNRAVLRTLTAAVPRVLFSLLIGFIIAEPLLLTVFDDEIRIRLQNIHQNSAQEAESEIDRSYAARLADLQTPRPGATDLQTVEKEIDQTKAQIDEAQARADNEDQLAQAEAGGNRIMLGGTTTTGKANCGDRCVQHQAHAKEARRNVAQLTERQQRLQTRAGELRRQIGGTEDERRAQLQHLRDVEIPQRKKDAREKAESSSGLLLRIKALEQLAVDRDPFSGDKSATAVSTPAVAHTSSAASASPTPTASRSAAPSAAASAASAADAPAAPQPSEFSTREDGFLGLTTLGWTVWIVRVWLIFIDAMPMLFKVLLALRARRPHDAAVARDEERAMAQRAAEVAWIRSKATREIIRAANAMRPRTSESSRLFLTRADGTTVILKRGDLILVDERGFAVASTAQARATVSYEDGRGWVVRAIRPGEGTGPNGVLFDAEIDTTDEKQQPPASSA